jgi:hypothetical protein
VHVERIVSYPEQGLAVLYDEQGCFAMTEDSDEILDLGNFNIEIGGCSALQSLVSPTSTTDILGS